MSIAEDQIKKELVNLNNFIEDKIKSIEKRFGIEVDHKFYITNVHTPKIFDEKGNVINGKF